MRVPLDRDAFESIARSGALDDFSEDSRTALWEVGVLFGKLGQAGQQSAQQTFFNTPIVTGEDIPSLPPLTDDERLSWDFMTHRAARTHPMVLARRSLQELEIRPVETCYCFPSVVNVSPTIRNGATITTAGIVILRQRPPTAKGFMFVTIEDETGFIQCVVPPAAQEYLDHVLTASALIVRGVLQAAGNWRGMILQQAWRLDGIFGGYEGFAGTYGGRDRWIRGSAPVYSPVTTASINNGSPQAHKGTQAGS
jgi:error-prone DNA polymerase